MKEIVRCCHVAVYVVMGVVVVASGSSPSAYIRGLIRRIDRGDPNGTYGTRNVIPARQTYNKYFIYVTHQAKRDLFGIAKSIALVGNHRKKSHKNGKEASTGPIPFNHFKAKV